MISTTAIVKLDMDTTTSVCTTAVIRRDRDMTTYV